MFRLIVPGLDTLVEFPRNTSDGYLVTDVGLPQPTRRQAANASFRRDEDHRLLHASCLDRRGYSGRGRTVNDEVVGSLFSYWLVTTHACQQ